MSKSIELFKKFLSNIEPSGKAVEYASDAHTRVRNHLEQDENFKENLDDSFLYGSYKRQTAICEIKDVDIVLLTTFNPEIRENTPQNVLKKVKDALNRYYEDTDNQQYQRRSIRVDDPLPEKKDANLTLDIIPAFAPSGEEEILLVPDRELKCWIESHPKGHIEYASSLNKERNSNGMFVPLVKIMKFWWKYQCENRQPDVERPKPKGFWMECLTGENFDKEQDNYANHFIQVLENISNKYADVSEVPELEDPGLKNREMIKTSMTREEFKLFMEAINESLILAKDAYEEESEEKSSKIWQEIFGKVFPIFSSEKYDTKNIINRDSGEEFLDDYGIREKISYCLKINAIVTQKGFQPFKLLGTKNFLKKERSLKFITEYCNVPQPYEIKWKVKNYGSEAQNADDLRGKISNDKGFHNRHENTKYAGEHYVECYAVKDGCCLAKDRIEVPIGRY